MKKSELQAMIQEELENMTEDLIGYKTTHAVDVLGIIMKSLEANRYTIDQSSLKTPQTNLAPYGAKCRVVSEDSISYNITITPITPGSGKPYVADNIQ